MSFYLLRGEVTLSQFSSQMGFIIFPRANSPAEVHFLPRNAMENVQVPVYSFSPH